MPSLFELAQFTPEELAERQRTSQEQVANAQPESELASEQALSSRSHLDDIRDVIGRRMQDKAVAKEFTNLTGVYEAGLNTIIGSVRLHARTVVSHDEDELSKQNDATFGSLLAPMVVPQDVQTDVMGKVLKSIDVPIEAIEADRSGPTSDRAKQIIPVVKQVISFMLRGPGLESRATLDKKLRRFSVDENSGFSDEDIQKRILIDLDSILDPVFRSIAETVTLAKQFDKEVPIAAEPIEGTLGRFATKFGFGGNSKISPVEDTNERLAGVLSDAAKTIACTMSEATKQLGNKHALAILSSADYGALQSNNSIASSEAIAAFEQKMKHDSFIDEAGATVKKSRKFYELMRYVYMNAGKEVPLFDGVEDLNRYMDSQSGIDERKVLEAILKEYEVLYKHYRTLDNSTDEKSRKYAIRKLARMYHSDLENTSDSNVNDREAALAHNVLELKIRLLTQYFIAPDEEVNRQIQKLRL